MDSDKSRMEKALGVIAAVRDPDIPTVCIREIHRRDMVDYGREPDGTEGVPCLAGEPGTPLPAHITGQRPEDYVIPRRRYSAVFGADLEILQKGLKAETLIMIGGLTGVCVHYSFVDGHQHDYHCRVASDCVGGSLDAAHDASLNAMEYLQTGAVPPSEDIIAAVQSHMAKAA